MQRLAWMQIRIKHCNLQSFGHFGLRSIHITVMRVPGEHCLCSINTDTDHSVFKACANKTGPLPSCPPLWWLFKDAKRQMYPSFFRVTHPSTSTNTNAHAMLFPKQRTVLWVDTSLLWRSPKGFPKWNTIALPQNTYLCPQQTEWVPRLL